MRLRRGNLEIKAPPGGPRRRLQNGDVIVVGDREMVFANPPMNEPEFEE